MVSEGRFIREQFIEMRVIERVAERTFIRNEI